MTIRPPSLRFAAAFAALLALLLLGLHWRPSRQVRLHQEHLLQAVEGRNWKMVSRLLSPDYHDRWGQTKQALLARRPQVFGNFLACGVQEDAPVRLEWRGNICAVRARIHIVGSGGPIAQFVMQQSEDLRQPSTLEWERWSWKPWDWALVNADQPELEIPADLEP